ncbi:MAG: RagB/SusD family nutrient uptake outer membrane protein [Arcicella sp.]|jgi:starch-binding outer membrane protein, SusD/RagB family|nr:RagB/SusD family nutrient uptake outer membrane protein [Arcicella sp.]
MNKYIKLATLGIGISLMSSCSLLEVDKILEPNNPTVESIESNATANQISQLGIGLQSTARNGIAAFYETSGSIGREIIRSASTDNRYFSEILGTVDIDPAGIFYGWYGSYNATRRRAELFIRSADNTNSITAAQKAGVRGFAKTIQAYAMLNCLNMLQSSGIRTSFTDLSAPGDLLKPGKFSDYAGGLAYCKTLIDEGNTALGQAGASFAFPMTAGWAGFNTPANFARFNRAIAARIAMYQKDWAGMNTALNQSFLNLSGPLSTGPVFTFSTTAGDLTNPLFQNRNTDGAPWVVQVRVVPEAEAGDTRIAAKMSRRNNPRASGNIAASEFEVFMYPSNTSPISIIRNEELVLMYAEAQLQTNNLVNAENALNIIRTSAGLRAYAGAKTAAALTDELLKQRRYSLFFEGHRWFDMRRYNRLGDLPKDLANHRVFAEMPRPQSEVDWDVRNP